MDLLRSGWRGLEAEMRIVWPATGLSSIGGCLRRSFSVAASRNEIQGGNSERRRRENDGIDN